MSKRAFTAISVVLLVLGILATWPDPPRAQVERPVEFPVISKESHGHNWRVEIYCPSVRHSGLEFHGPSAEMVGWSSLLIEVVSWDECIVGDELEVLKAANFKARVGWRPSNPSNSQSPTLGFYFALPWYARGGILGNHGLVPFFALEWWPAHGVILISWVDSPLCKGDDHSTCQFDLREWRMRSQNG